MVAVIRSGTKDLAVEAELMMKITNQTMHPHILRLLWIEYDVSERVSMVAPIAPFGSIVDLVDHLEFEGLEVGPGHKRQAFAQALSAVLRLNSIGVDHGDVAARNLLVFHYNPHQPRLTDVRLCDFGDARKGCTPASALCALARELAGL